MGGLLGARVPKTKAIWIWSGLDDPTRWATSTGNSKWLATRHGGDVPVARHVSPTLDWNLNPRLYWNVNPGRWGDAPRAAVLGRSARAPSPDEVARAEFRLGRPSPNAMRCRPTGTLPRGPPRSGGLSARGPIPDEVGRVPMILADRDTAPTPPRAAVLGRSARGPSPDDVGRQGHCPEGHSVRAVCSGPESRRRRPSGSGLSSCPGRITWIRRFKPGPLRIGQAKGVSKPKLPRVERKIAETSSNLIDKCE